MAIVEAINIPIGVTGTETVQQAANSYEDLGDAVAKTQLEAERLAQQFGINDKRTQDAIRVAGKYKQEMEQLDFAIDGARGGLDTLFRATQGVIAGFELAAGATALFGVESEDLQRILLKVQGAMVFSQGLKDIKEFAPAMLQVARATREWFVSLTLVQKAFLTFGIGFVIETVYQLSQAFGEVSAETKEAAKSQEEYNNKLREFQIERIRIQKGEKAALEARQQDIASILRQNNAFIENAKIREESIRGSLKLGVDSVTETDRLRREEVKRLKLVNAELENEQLRNAEKIRQIELTKQQSTIKTKTIEVDSQKEVNEERAKTTAEMDAFIAKQNEVTGAAIDNITKVNELTIEQNDTLLNTIEARQLSALEKAEIFIGAYGEDLKAMFSQALYAIDDLSQAFAGNDEARQRKAFELSKKLSIVQTTMATIETTVQAFKEAQKNPLNQATGGAYAFGQAAIAAAFGLAQIQQIRNQQFTGGTNPSVQNGGGAAAVPRFQAPTTRLPQTDEFTQVRRVYVTERDITNVQDKVRVTESLSQF
jgi:hypothetical protein